MRHLTAFFAAATVLAGSALIAEDAYAQTTLRLGHVVAPTEPAGQGTEMFAQLVEEYTNGDVTIQVFPNGQLGNNRQLFTQVRTGALDMSVTFHSMMADIVPEFTAYISGYFYEDWDQLRTVLEHPEYGRVWDERLIEEGGLRVLDVFYFGARNLTTTETEIRSPADLDGMKIRAVPTDISLAVVGGMGANPTPVPFPELFQALRQGVVDGQENPIPTIVGANLQEVQDYLILTRHQINPGPWVVNEAVWQELSAENQDAILRAASEAAEWTTNAVLEQEQSLIDDLRAGGMNVIELTDEERGEFAAAVRASVVEAFDGPKWPEGMAQEIFDVLQ